MGRDAEHWTAVEEAAELLIEGEAAKAITLLRDVLAGDPKNPYGFFYLATALYEIERFDAARDAYRAAVTLAPDYVGARVGLSHTHRQLHAYVEAVEAAEQALKRVPDDGEALYAAGLACASLGDRSKATKFLKKFLKTDPELEVQLEARGLIEMLAQGHEGDPFNLA
jgi:tetratricopeptide (TPR) repeat protein